MCRKGQMFTDILMSKYPTDTLMRIYPTDVLMSKYPSKQRRSAQTGSSNCPGLAGSVFLSRSLHKILNLDFA